MKKITLLPESTKKTYVSPYSKSKSPFNTFKKTPPKNVFQKTPPKQYPPLMGVTFSAKGSSKTTNIYEAKFKNPSGKVHRQFTVQDDLSQRSDIENVQQNLTPRTISFIQDEYFQRSLAKISQVRSRKDANSISIELNEVLNMIKEQKIKIDQKMKKLKNNNSYYRRLCEGYVPQTTENGVNPLDLKEIIKVEEKQTHMGEEEKVILEQLYQQKNKLREKQLKERQRETYMKLYSMLQDMKIDYHSILPQPPMEITRSQQKIYKNLTESQMIKIQRFFIKKLSEKLTK